MRDVVPESKLEVAWLSDATIAQYGSALPSAVPAEGLEEEILRGLQVGGIRKSRSVDDRLGGGQRLAVERDDASDEVLDECVEIGVWNRAVDPTVTPRRLCIVVVPTQHDFEGAGPSHQERQSLKGAASGD